MMFIAESSLQRRGQRTAALSKLFFFFVFHYVRILFENKKENL
ncbi:hypothetical protein PAECIP112173_00975 [Paenibacillus sp. JJ-100]|nr:hypothetical protein PAECIP112173_00975 [Paenibacillus sp. JJ-100]